MLRKTYTSTQRCLFFFETLLLTAILLTAVSTRFFVVPSAHSAPTTSDPRPLRIVNIGDGYASGDGILPTTNQQCGQSHDNYARQIATALHAILTDVSCSGAKIDNLQQPQRGANNAIINDAQDKGLTGDDDIVLVSLGASDVDFIGSAIACASQQIIFPDCQITRTAIENQLPPVQDKLNQAYAHIRKIDQHAQIFAIGYGRPLTSTMCLQAPLNAQNSQWVSTIIDTLSTYAKNSVTAQQGDYVDTAALSLGHSICSSQPWYVGMLPQAIGDGIPGHPRKIWHQAIAANIVQGEHPNTR